MKKETLLMLGFKEAEDRYFHTYGFIIMKEELEKFQLHEIFTQALKFSYSKGKKDGKLRKD